MPALTDITRYKRLADLLAMAVRLEPSINPARHQRALKCLLEHGMSERQAEQFLQAALDRHERNLLRSSDHVIGDVANCFRQPDHSYLLNQVQTVLEAGEVTDQHQTFFDLCCKALFHGQS